MDDSIEDKIIETNIFQIEDKTVVKFILKQDYPEVINAVLEKELENLDEGKNIILIDGTQLTSISGDIEGFSFLRRFKGKIYKFYAVVPESKTMLNNFALRVGIVVARMMLGVDMKIFRHIEDAVASIEEL